MSLGITAKAIGHYIEQPAVIDKAGKKALGLAIGGATALLGHDIYLAQPEERTKVAIKNGLVIAATMAGTWIATKKFMMPFVHKTEVVEAKRALRAAVESLKDKYSPELREMMLKPTKDRPREFADIMEGMKKELQAKLGDENLVKAEFQKDIQKILPVELDDSFMDSLKKMGNFFIVGGASVLSGLFGGILANKITGDKKSNTVDMVKEGIFQFIANIALCAVGASVGISVVNQKTIKNKLAQMGMSGKLLRTGIIGAGLSLGIFGGGAIANKIGHRWVNPFFDRMEGKQPSPAPEKRHIEFWDAILHLDDLPTALALAGVKILEPFIPLFFAFSGYRTGIGYRNDENAPAPSVARNPFSSPSSTSALMGNNRVFQQFYQNRHSTAG